MSLKSKKDIEALRISGRILTETLRALRDIAREGVNLLVLERTAREHIEKSGTTPAFLGYKTHPNATPYPAAICTSINEEIVHGKPRDYILKSGDILKIDVGIQYDKYITDAAITIGIGKVTEENKKLIETAKIALKKGIEACVAGKFTGDIGHAIETAIKGGGCNVIQKLTGHGVGFALHEPPSVFNYGDPKTGTKLEVGMVLAIEPMATTGTGEVIEKKDGTFVTQDGAVAAHVERTIAITSSGPETLTPWEA